MFKRLLTYLAIGVYVAVPLGMPVPHFHGTEYHVHWGGGFHHDDSHPQHAEEHGHTHGHHHAHDASDHTHGGHHHDSSRDAHPLQLTDASPRETETPDPHQPENQDAECGYCSLADAPLVGTAKYNVTTTPASQAFAGGGDHVSLPHAAPSAHQIRGPPRSNEC